MSQDQRWHSWLRKIHICFIPGATLTPLENRFIQELLAQFNTYGHLVQANPDNDTDIILTNAKFGQPLSWRRSFLFTGRLRFHLDRSPTVYTVIQVHPKRLEGLLAHFEKALAKETPDPADYEFPGLARGAFNVLHEQGMRGGPILAVERLLQAQSKSIHILLLVGDQQLDTIYHFDLVGGYPQSKPRELQGTALYEDIVLRMVTTVSTHEITDHQVVGEAIDLATWKSLETPAAMCEAAKELDQRNFFTEMVRIADLIHAPSIAEAVSHQYSEGCFATWEPRIDALITTITGSARPINKGEITENDLAVIVGVRPDRLGAMIRHVMGKQNDPPSSEAVEMMEVDTVLPKVTISLPGFPNLRVPVIRSKLHGHRGISAYNPDLVEFLSLDPPYYNFPVSCATAAQAQGIREAFLRSEALNNPEDPRQLVFTVLPTHGVVIAEKWLPDKKPFQLMLEYLDAHHIVLDNLIPQGEIVFVPSENKRVLADP